MLNILISGHRGEGVSSSILSVVMHLTQSEQHSIIIVNDEWGEFPQNLDFFDVLNVSNCFEHELKTLLLQEKRFIRVINLGYRNLSEPTMKIRTIVEKVIPPNCNQKVYFVSKKLID